MRERIQHEALVLVVERGYAGMSLRAVARRLEVTVAALYYHYPAKDDLLDDLLQPYYDRLTQIVEEAPRGSSSTERRVTVEHVLSGVLEMTLADPDRVALASVDAAVRHHVEHGPKIAAAQAELRDLLGSTPDDAALLGGAALGALVGPLLNVPHVDPERARHVLLPAAMRVVLQGM